MAGFQDQQALQQLLSGMNTMQMQAGLMPGGIPLNSQPPPFVPPRVQSPAEFSNSLSVDYSRRFNPVTSLPPMYGGVSPTPRNDYAMGMLPPPMIGSGWGAARQYAQGSANRMLSGAHIGAGLGGGLVGTGLGASIGTVIGGGLGTFFGGPAGTLAGAKIGGTLGGIAGGFGGGYAGDMAFNPFIAQRERALQLQNTSMLNVRTGPDLSASGMGLSGSAAMHFERNLMNMSDSRQFQRDTQNMFNRQDMMKMTNISAQVGLLDNTQSVEQMTKEMGKIGRALKTFMRVVEEPDVQEALKMMGKMRTLGMSIPETNVAAANARTFARMAGTTVQGVMSQGMAGAGLYQQYGMSGASGLNAGMAGVGIAGQIATQMDPRQLALLGGREGMAQNLTTASAKISQMDALLPGLANLGKDGKLSINQDALSEFAQGKRNAIGLVQESARRLSGMGPQGFIEAYTSQKRDLQDQLMQSLGGKGSVLAPYLMAKAYVDTGAAKTLAGGLRLADYSEEEARTLEVAFQQPDFFKRLRASDRPESYTNQGLRRRQRQLQSEYAGSEGWDRVLAPVDWSRARKRMGRGFDEMFQNKFGSDTDILEMQSATGGGDIIRALRPTAYGSEEQLNQMRTELAGPRGGRLRQTARDQRVETDRMQRNEMERAVEYERSRVPFASSLFQGQRGPDGMGFGPHSEYITSTISRNEGLGQRLDRMIGITPKWAQSTDALKRKIGEVESFGAEVERGLAGQNDPRKLRDFLARMEKSGVSRDAALNMLSKASAGMEQYLEERHVAGITLSAATGEKTQAAMRDALLSGGVGKEQAAAFVGDAATRELVIGMGAGGRTQASRETLDRAVAGASDVVSSARLQGIGAIRKLGARERKGALGLLGITGTGGTEEEKARLLDVFGAKGDEASLRKKAVAIRTIERSAEYDTAHGNIEQAKRKNARAVSLRGEMQAEAGRDEEGMQRIEAAHAYAAGVVEGISGETQELVGGALGAPTLRAGQTDQDFFEKTMGSIEKRATRYGATDLSEGMFKKLGAGGLAAYDTASRRKGATAQSIMKAVSAYAQKGELGTDITDKEREALASGKISYDELHRAAAAGALGGADAAVAGGGTTLRETKTGVDKIADEMVGTLEKWSKATHDRANTSFDKLDVASSKLLRAAAIANPAAAGLSYLGDKVSSLVDDASTASGATGGSQ